MEIDPALINTKIAERERTLRDIHGEFAKLRERQLVTEAELRIYREFLNGVPTALEVGPIIKAPSNKLGEVWQAVFGGLVKNKHTSYSLQQLRDLLNARFGDLGDSFRVSAYRHVQAGNMDKKDNGEYQANRRTAEIIGVDWDAD